MIVVKKLNTVERMKIKLANIKRDLEKRKTFAIDTYSAEIRNRRKMRLCY